MFYLYILQTCAAKKVFSLIAAKKIVNALHKKKKMFIFPWQWHIVIAFKGLLDIFMASAARKMHKKSK